MGVHLSKENDQETKKILNYICIGPLWSVFDPPSRGQGLQGRQEWCHHLLASLHQTDYWRSLVPQSWSWCRLDRYWRECRCWRRRRCWRPGGRSTTGTGTRASSWPPPPQSSTRRTRNRTDQVHLKANVRDKFIFNALFNHLLKWCWGHIWSRNTSYKILQPCARGHTGTKAQTLAEWANSFLIFFCTKQDSLATLLI